MVLENEYVEDVIVVFKLLCFILLVSLLVFIVLVIKIFFFSDMVVVYELNWDLFFNVGFVCIVIYFVIVYWVMCCYKVL